MAMEPKGPGSVGNAYGARTVNQPSQIGSAKKLRPNYTEFSQSGGEPVTVKKDLVTGGLIFPDGDGNPQAFAGAPSKYYLACIPGRQFVTSGVPKDLSANAADAVFGSALTDANLWATNGYMTTAALANGALNIPLAKSTFNLGTESLIFSMLLKKAAPAGSDVSFGNGNASTKEGFYLSCRATSGSVRPIFAWNVASVVSANTGLADSAAIFCDGTDHVLTLAIDAVTKIAYLWRDGCLSNTYVTGIPANGFTVPSSPFGLGGSEAGLGIAAQFAGVHLLKFTGGLPLNINKVVAKLASRPFEFLTNLDIQIG